METVRVLERLVKDHKVMANRADRTFATKDKNYLKSLWDDNKLPYIFLQVPYDGQIRITNAKPVLEAFKKRIKNFQKATKPTIPGKPRKSSGRTLMPSGGQKELLKIFTYDKDGSDPKKEKARSSEVFCEISHDS